MSFLKNPKILKRLVLFALILTALIVGTVTVFRAAIFETSRTDLTVYIRAAQAIVNHENIYSVENIRHWHYVYLPLLAILMVPFVFMPLWLSASLWYSLSLAALVGVYRGLSSLFESENTRFWIPLTCIIVAIPPLMNTLTRGQLGILSLYLTLLPFLLDQHGKKFSAGFVLGFGIILKISPLMILPFYFVLQRNWRALAGCVCGGLVFGILLPAVIFGPALSWEYIRTYFQAISQGAGDQARQSYLWGELFTPFAADNQSFYALFTRLYWKDEIYFLWKSNLGIRLINLSIMGFMTAGIMWIYFLNFKNRKSKISLDKTKADFIVFSLLACVMLFTSPVTQPHHYTPLVLLAVSSFFLMRSNPALRGILISAMLVCLIGFSSGILSDPLADAGWPILSSFFLWSVVFVSALRKA